MKDHQSLIVLKKLVNISVKFMATKQGDQIQNRLSNIRKEKEMGALGYEGLTGAIW